MLGEDTSGSLATAILARSVQVWGADHLEAGPLFSESGQVIAGQVTIGGLARDLTLDLNILVKALLSGRDDVRAVL